MMKRKTGNRDGWSRIKSQKYTQTYLETPEFKGFISLILFKEAIHPLKAKIAKEAITLVNNNTYLMQHIPDNANFALTTFINENGQILQWYIDIIDSSGIENGIPYFDDLYLDLIVTPDGRIIEKDIDELEEAYLSGDISKEQYDKAWQYFKQYKQSIINGTFYCINESLDHFQILQQQIES